MSFKQLALPLLLAFLAVSGTVLGQMAQPQISTSPKGLSAALQAVIANNPAIKGQLAEVEAQGYVVDTSRAARYPTLSLTADNINEEFDDQGTVRLDQPLYAFGKINAGIDEAKAGYNVQLLELLQVQRQLIEDTAAAYVNVRGITQRAQLARLNIEEHERLYQRIERRQQGQLASEADVTLANSRLVQARATLDQIKGEYQVALAELRSLTLVNVPTDQPVNPALSQLPNEQELQKLAADSSADIGLRREEIEQVRTAVEREKVDYLPTVFLRAEYDFLDQQLNNDPERIGVALESSLEGLGFAARGRIKGASARLAAADQQLGVTQEEVRREVSVLHANKETQINLIRSQKLAIEAVESTLESFIRQYETGRKSWVDVLNTQRELTNLRFDLVRFEADLMTFSVRLQALIGNLDQMAGIETL